MSGSKQTVSKFAEQAPDGAQPAGHPMPASRNSSPLTVGLVQINNSFSGQNYLPYSTGLLQSYVEKYAAHPDRYTFLLPVYSRIAVQQAVDRLVGADVVAF